MIIREMRGLDFSQVLKIEKDNYESPEQLSVLKQKWITAPEYCLVAEHNSEIGGFIIAYPANKNHVAELHCKSLEHITKKEKQSLYIHDIAVSEKFKGMGIGSKLCNKVWGMAKENNLKTSHLVAVTETAALFWKKYGYRPSDITASEYGYSDESIVMHCEI